MIEYKVIILRGIPDDGWEYDLNVLAKEGWRVTQVLRQDGWPILLMARPTLPEYAP